MYVICYGKSPKALATGQKLINEIGGRYVTGTELMTGSFVMAEGETNCAIVMVLPLEAAVKSMEETITDKTRDLPVIAVSPEGRYAAVLRRGNKPYEKGVDDVYAAVVEWLNANGYESDGPMFNIYHVSPHETQNPDEFVTEVCYPVKKKT